MRIRLSTTSIMDCQLLRQRGSQKISVIKVNTFVFVVFKTKHELECQNELFLNHHISGNTSISANLLLRLLDELLT